MNEDKFPAKEEAEYWTARAEELQAYEEAELKSLAERAEQFDAEQDKANTKGIARLILPDTACITTSMQSEQQSSAEADTNDTMSEDGMGDYAKGNSATECAPQIKGKNSRLEEQDEQLLPGILNDITYDCICPKLPRTESQVLSSLNHAWEEAVGSDRFYNARVRYNSVEILAVHSHSSFGGGKVAVYSLRDKWCYELPSIPQLDSGVPMDCQCVSLNGKVYILGGEDDDTGNGKKEVYMFDLASRKQYWQQCASMQSGRRRFGCSVLDGKIFVVGGYGTNEGDLPVQGSDVYDPKINAWFPISPPRSLRVDHHIATFGGELVLYGGYDHDGASCREAEFVEVYCPTTDEWRTVDPLFEVLRYPDDGLFTVDGKWYFLSDAGIYVHDIDKNSWEQLHSNSFPVTPNEWSSIDIFSSVVVNNDELAIGVHWYIIGDLFRTGSCLLHSKGFRGTQKEIVWEVVPHCDGAFQYFTCPIML